MTGGREDSALHDLVASQAGDERAVELLDGLELHPDVLAPAGGAVPRAVLAQALGVLLLHDLLGRVSELHAGRFSVAFREALPDGSGPDLAFDAANAQQIFAMTRGAGPDAVRP